MRGNLVPCGRYHRNQRRFTLGHGPKYEEGGLDAEFREKGQNPLRIVRHPPLRGTYESFVADSADVKPVFHVYGNRISYGNN